MGSLQRALRYSVVLALGMFSYGALAADFSVSQVNATSFNGSTTLSWSNQSSHFYNNTPGNIEIGRSFGRDENSFVVLMNLATNRTSVQLSNLPQGSHFLRVRYAGRTSRTGGGNWDGIIRHEVLAEPAATTVQTPSVSVSSSYQITISSQDATRYEYRYVTGHFEASFPSTKLTPIVSSKQSKQESHYEHHPKSSKRTPSKTKLYLSKRRRLARINQAV